MTIYFCPRCKTKDHWANEVCPKGVAPQVPVGIGKRQEALPEVAAPIRKAQAFIDKVRFDRVAYQREYMRKRRASKREKVLGDGGGAVTTGSKPE